MGAHDEEIQRNIRNAKLREAARRESEAMAERVLSDPKTDPDQLFDEVSGKLFRMPFSDLVDAVPTEFRDRFFNLLDEAALDATRDRAALGRILF